LHESHTSSSSPEATASFYDDFEHSIQSRADLHDDVPLSGLQQENNLPISLLDDFAPQTSITKDVTEDALDFTNPPTGFNHSCEFEEGEEFESTSEFDEHHDFNNHKIFVYRSHVWVWLSPLIWKLTMIISLWNMSLFHMGLTSMRVWMWIYVFNMNPFPLTLS